MNSPRRAAAHPTLLATLIGGLVLAGVIALFTVLGGANSSSGATNDRAAAKQSSTSAAPSTPAVSSTPAKTSAPATTSHAPTKPAIKPGTKPATKPAAKTKPANTSLAAPARRSVTYVVKHGDTLTVIAAWFHQHGYGDLYDRNRQVIGKNPNLIIPGERITVSGAGMTLAR